MLLYCYPKHYMFRLKFYRMQIVICLDVFTQHWKIGSSSRYYLHLSDCVYIGKCAHTHTHTSHSLISQLLPLLTQNLKAQDSQIKDFPELVHKTCQTLKLTCSTLFFS